MEALIQVKSQLADILKNCPLTNLIQESSFGDSDYDIKKRPNCSILQRTAQHCVCSNKTASVYLYKIVPVAENAYVAIFDSKYIINFSFKLSEKKIEPILRPNVHRHTNFQGLVINTFLATEVQK